MTAKWNQCDVCGRFVSMVSLAAGTAKHTLLEPDSELSVEKWETLCYDHYKPRRAEPCNCETFCENKRSVVCMLRAPNYQRSPDRITGLQK